MNSYLFTPFIKTEYGTSKTRMDRSHVGARHGSCRWSLRTHYRLLGIILGETRHGAAKCTQGNKTTRYIILLLINFLKSGCAPAITTEGHVAWQEPGALAFGCLWQPFLTQPGQGTLASSAATCLFLRSQVCILKYLPSRHFVLYSLSHICMCNVLSETECNTTVVPGQA